MVASVNARFPPDIIDYISLEEEYQKSLDQADVDLRLKLFGELNDMKIRYNNNIRGSNQSKLKDDLNAWSNKHGTQQKSNTAAKIMSTYPKLAGNRILKDRKTIEEKNNQKQEEKKIPGGCAHRERSKSRTRGHSRK